MLASRCSAATCSANGTLPVPHGQFTILRVEGQEMSYSTALYAVDLDRLNQAIGSGEQSLLATVRGQNEATPIEPLERRQIWIAVLEDGTLTLDRNHATLEQVEERYAELAHHDVAHFLGKNADVQKQVFLSIDLIAQSKPGNAANLNLHSPQMDLGEFHAYEDHVPESGATAAMIEQACEQLIAGRVSGDVPTACYGYALQQFCNVLGRRLDDEDAVGEIQQLDLETPLEELREVDRVPADGDFPIVSYLTFTELGKELKRLDSRKIAATDDPEVAAGRQALLKCLREAHDEGLGIVSFYY